MNLDTYEKEFIYLLEKGISYNNAVNVLRKNFPEIPGIEIKVPAKIILKYKDYTRTGKEKKITEEKWPEFAKEIIELTRGK